MSVPSIRKSGEVLDVIVDNRASCDGVPAAVVNYGNEVLEISEVGESTWRIRIRKGRAAQPRGIVAARRSEGSGRGPAQIRILRSESELMTTVVELTAIATPPRMGRNP